MPENTFVEQDDRWILPVQGKEITRCCVDYRFSLDMYIQANDCMTVTIETPFGLQADGQDHTLSPGGDSTLLGPALSLLHKTVQSGTAWKAGRLEIVFRDGTTLTVQPDPDYEAWEVTSAGGGLVVCCPGGGLAVWQAETG